MKKYYLMGTEKQNIYSIIELGKYYEYVKKNNVEMTKYYKMAIDIITNNSIWNVYDYTYKSATTLYNIAIDDGNIKFIYNLAEYYKNMKNYKVMIKYYLMAIEKECVSSMYNLACHYKNNYKHSEMIKYYLMAIEKECHLSMNDLGEYYENIEKYEEMEKYYLMGVKKGNITSLHNMNNYFSNNLKFYGWLVSIKLPNDIITNKINDLFKKESVINYIEKIELNKNNIKECIICYENNIHIPLPFECRHEVCVLCYFTVEKCYYNCDYIIPIDDIEI